MIYNTSQTASTTASELSTETGVKVSAYQADVTQQSAIEATIQQIAKDFGKLDIIVANSGIASHHAAEDYTPEQWSEIMKVNLDGAFYTAQAASRVFKAQGFGNVIFTASVSAILVNVPQKQAAVSFSFLESPPFSSRKQLIHIAAVQRIESGGRPSSKESSGRMG